MSGKNFWRELAEALVIRPPRREPVRPIKEAPNFYGGNGTIHQTGHVDVQLDRDGNVVAVWFRCAMLPFSESIVDDVYASQVAGAEPARIKGIVFEGDE